MFAVTLFPHDPVPFLLRLAWIVLLVWAMWRAVRGLRRRGRRALLPVALLIAGVAMLWHVQDLFTQLRAEIFDITRPSLRPPALLTFVGAVCLVGGLFWLSRGE